MSQPVEPEDCASTRFYTLAAISLLIVAALATAASWRLYPLFIDTYYHMGVIEGFSQAGGITTRAFWELAPGGRVHIYPPALHVIGYFFALAGVTPRTFITLVSATCYAGCLLTTWIWLRRIIGARGALFGVLLLCGPYAFFWTQASFTAVAGVMVLAPLALLALETEHFLACAVLNFVALTMHPIGLFLPPALAINALLRRKRSIVGLLAASVPVVLYGPWLAHIWANRALLPDSRTGGEVSVGGFGVGGLNLGLLLAALAVLSIPWLVKRRGPALGLVGALLGFAVVFPMGFGGRFLAFNIHWPLACLGGYGLAELVRWLEQRARLRAGVHVFSIVLVGTALVAYPALEMPLPKSEGPPGRPPAGGEARDGPPAVERPRDETRSALPDLRFTVQAGALPKLFDAYSGAAADAGMGPPGAPGRRPNAGPPTGGPPGGPGRPIGRASGGGPGGFGADSLRRPGAEGFFNAVKSSVRRGDVIYVADPMGASLLVGVTGRWTSGGILRDVRSENGRTRPEECDFAAVLARGTGPGPGGPMGAQGPPSSFEKVFENEYGALYRNPAQREHAREPLKPDVRLCLLMVIAVVGLLLVVVDFLSGPRRRVRLLAAGLGTFVVALCFVPLASAALRELRNPPAPPPRGRDDGPGFGGPGFGPGPLLAEDFIRAADTDGSGTASLEEFRALAERWSHDWDADGNGSLDPEEVTQGFQSLVASPPDGPPGLGPGTWLAQRVFSACDTNGDGTLTRDELVAAFERWFREWDAEGRGSLDPAALGQGLERLVGSPPVPGEMDRAETGARNSRGIP